MAGWHVVGARHEGMVRGRECSNLDDLQERSRWPFPTRRLQGLLTLQTDRQVSVLTMTDDIILDLR